MPGYSVYLTMHFGSGAYTNQYKAPGAGQFIGNPLDSYVAEFYIAFTVGATIPGGDGSYDAPVAGDYVTATITSTTRPAFLYTCTFPADTGLSPGDFPWSQVFDDPSSKLRIELTDYISTHHIVGDGVTGEGTVSPDVGSTFTSADTLLFTVTPDAGYKVTSFTLDGVPRAVPEEGGTFDYGSGHDADVDMEAVFEVIAHEIHSTVGDHGSVTPVDGTEFTPGDPLVFTFTPESTDYRVSSATIDIGAGAVDITTQARTGTYNIASGPDHDITLVVTFEYLVVNVTLRLTAAPATDCPAGQRVVAEAFQADLIVPGVGLLSIWNDTEQSITQTTTAEYNPFIGGLLIGVGTGWVGNQITSSSITGATGYSAVTDGLSIPKTAFTPGTDVVITVTTSTNRLCSSDVITPPPSEEPCPEGTVWSGTACVPVSSPPPSGHACPAGTVWDGTACVVPTDDTYLWVPPDPDPEPHPDPSPDPDPDPVPEPPPPGKGRFHVTAYYELAPVHIAATVDTHPLGQTPCYSSLMSEGTYTVAVSDGGSLVDSRTASIVSEMVTEVRFDFFGSETNGLRVRAVYDGEYVNVPFTLTAPDTSTTDEVCPYSSDGIATGTWTASTTWRGETITGSAVVAATGVEVILLILPSVGATLTEDEVLGDAPNVFQVRWRDEYGPWSPWRKIDLGLQGHDEPFRWLSPMGIYRHRQYEFMATGPDPLVVVWVEEDVEPMGS